MKKLIAVLLTCVLMLTLSVPAMGENCYEMMKALFTDPDNDPYLGDPITIGYDSTQRILLLYTAGTIGLFGVNSNGQGEAAMWLNVDETKAVTIFYVLSASWDFVAGMPDDGYSFYMVMATLDHNFDIDDAESAADYMAAVEELVKE